MGPEDALEARNEIIQALADPQQAWAYEAWALMRDIAQPGTPEAADTADAVRNTLVDSLGRADTYWVAPNMVDLLEQASNSMPAQSLEPAHLPGPVGFIKVARGFELPESNLPDTKEDIATRKKMLASFGYSEEEIERICSLNKETHVYITGLMWIDMEALYSYHGWETSPEHKPGLFVAAFFRSREDVTLEPAELAELRTGQPKWLLLDVYRWDYGDDWARGDALVEQDEFLGTTWLSRIFATFWTLVDQQLTDVTIRQPPRAFARRCQRVGLPSEIKVVTLRRRHTHSEPTGEKTVDWSHQWVVEGHWRNQPWGPGRTRRRQQYIAPFIKGPDDKPLKLKDTVFSWQR